jgi:hypothetical protein
VTVQLEGDVNNDGFDGFFSFSGAEAAETIAALEAIDAHGTAAIVRRACARFPDGMPPKDKEVRRALLLELVNPDGGAFEAADADFLRYDDDLEALVGAYESRYAAPRDIPER